MWPLYAAGFTTAFGAHGIAANLGGHSEDAVTSLLVLGGLLALYDGAEVLLKPVFGTIADRIGARPVLLGGLVAFAAASVLYVVVDSPGWLWAARLGQGAAASAFSPAASALVARLNPAAKHGRAYGSYGFYKSLGYTLGPLLGGVLVWAGGLRLLFAVLAALGAVVAVWAVLAVPHVPPLPRARQTVLDLARRLADPVFLTPTAALAGATAALSVGVGFLPVSGAVAGLGTVATGAAVSVLAACAAVVQPRAGRALDAGRLTARTGIGAGLLITAAGLACRDAPRPDRRASRRGTDRRRHGADHPAGLRRAGCQRLRRNGSARPWGRPSSGANSATRAGRCWSRGSRPWRHSLTGTGRLPCCWRWGRSRACCCGVARVAPVGAASRGDGRWGATSRVTAGWEATESSRPVRAVPGGCLTAPYSDAVQTDAQ